MKFQFCEIFFYEKNGMQILCSIQNERHFNSIRANWLISKFFPRKNKNRDSDTKFECVGLRVGEENFSENALKSTSKSAGNITPGCMATRWRRAKKYT